MTGVDDARRRFADAGLPLPPIPADLQGRVRQIGDFTFGTRDDGPGPYGLEWYVEELLEGRCAEPYLLFGHDGTGFNSWALHYHLVRGGLAVFDQIAWGGAYTDDALAERVVPVHWAQITDLLAAVDTAGVDPGQVDPRYVVAASDFGSSRWARGSLAEGWSWEHGSPLSVVVEAAIAAQEDAER